MTLYNRQLLMACLASVVMPSLSQASLIIDQFVVNQSVTSGASAVVSSSATPGGLFMNTVTNTSVVAADREILVDRVTAATQSRVAALASNSSTANYLVLDSNPDSGTPLGQGVGEVVYETQQSGDAVISSFGAAPDVYTLGLNLFDYGSQFEILGRADAATGTIPVYVTLYGSGAQSAQTASAQFNLTSTNTVFAIPLASFTGNTSILTNVGAIRVLVGSGPTRVGTTADVYLDYLSITGAVIPQVPEPATMGILGSGLVALGALARYRKQH